MEAKSVCGRHMFRQLRGKEVERFIWLALGLEVRNKHFYNTSNEEGKEKRREKGNHVKILALFTLLPVPVGIISIIIFHYGALTLNTASRDSRFKGGSKHNFRTP